VAFVLLPPMKSLGCVRLCFGRVPDRVLTVLVKKHDVAAGKVDGVSSAQAGHCRSDQ